MKKIGLLFVIAAFALTGLNMNTAFAGEINKKKLAKSAAYYNDAIISHQHEIAEEFVDFFGKFKTASLEELKAEREDLLSKINVSIKEIGAFPAFKGDAKFRDGALEQFYFYKSTLELEYEQMIKLIANRERSPEDSQKLKVFRDSLILREEQIDAKFEQIQQAFAKEHNLTLVKSEIKK